MTREAIQLLAPHVVLDEREWDHVLRWAQDATFAVLAELVPLAQVLLGAAIADVAHTRDIPAWLAISHVHAELAASRAPNIYASELRELLEDPKTGIN